MKSVIDMLADPSRWEKIERGVTVFLEHEAHVRDPQDRDKEIVIKYDRARLESMVDQIKRQRAHGVVPRETIGHMKMGPAIVITDKGEKIIREQAWDQENQPDIIGVYDNHRVELVVNEAGEKKYGIVADRFSLPGHGEDDKKYPYRSPEFVPKEVAQRSKKHVPELHHDLITAVALLKTDPQLDMGMTLYAESPEVKRLRLRYHALDPEEFMAEETKPADEKDEKEFKERFSRAYPKFAEYYQGVVEKYSGCGMSAPSATNLNLPAGLETHMQRNDPVSQNQQTPPAVVGIAFPAGTDPALAETIRNLQQQHDIEKSRYQRAEEATKQEVAELRKLLIAQEDRATLERYRADWVGLKGENFEFSLDEEVKACLDAGTGRPITQAEHDRRVATCKQYYRRAPVGGGNNLNAIPDVRNGTMKTIQPGTGITPDGKGGAVSELEFTNDDIMPCVRYQEEHKIGDFQEAVNKYMAEKKTKLQPTK